MVYRNLRETGIENMKSTDENSGNKEDLQKRAKAYNKLKHNNLCLIEKITIIALKENDIYIFKSNRQRKHKKNTNENNEKMEELMKDEKAQSNIPKHNNIYTFVIQK